MFLTLCGRGRFLSTKFSSTVKGISCPGQTNFCVAVKQCEANSRRFFITNIGQSKNCKLNRNTFIRPNPLFHNIKCGFRTSQQNRAVPPILWIVVKPVMKIATLLMGRASRAWFRDLPLWKRIMYPCVFMCSVFGTMSTIYHYYDSNQHTTPISNRKQFIMLTPEQIMKVGEFEAEQHLQDYKDKTLPNTHPLYQRLLLVAKKILLANQDLQMLREMNWKICIVDDKSLNAFVLPTGHVFFTTGILDFIENEDQLAVVFAHEMSHTLCSHPAETLSRVQYLDYFIIFFMAAIWTMIPSDGIAMVTQWFMGKVIHYIISLPFSRELEEEADIVGMELAAKACYDVREGSVFWRKMAMNSDLTGQKSQQFASTHPSNETRVAIIESVMSKVLDIRNQCNCPELPALDPRVRSRAIQKKVDNVLIARSARQNLAMVPKLNTTPQFTKPNQ